MQTARKRGKLSAGPGRNAGSGGFFGLEKPDGNVRGPVAFYRARVIEWL